VSVRPAYTIAVGVAAVLAVVAAFLPWTELTVEVPILGDIGGVTRRGYEGDGIITLLLSVVALGFAGYVWWRGNESSFRLVAAFNASLGVVVVVTALVNLYDSERALGDVQDQLDVDILAAIGVDLQSLTETGAGIYVTIAAGAVLTAASVGAFVASRRTGEARNG
jgi:hypothetical protein